MENTLRVTGRILGLQAKQTQEGTPFYVVDLETFYGQNIRFQAWQQAYDYIRKNQLRTADASGVGGDYLEVQGWVHNYNLTTSKGVLELTTFKSHDVRKPFARVSMSGFITHLNREKDPQDNSVYFKFEPEQKYKDCQGQWQKITNVHCVVDGDSDIAKFLLNTPDKVLKNKNYIISGIVDNTRKKSTLINVEDIEQGEQK